MFFNFADRVFFPIGKLEKHDLVDITLWYSLAPSHHYITHCQSLYQEEGYLQLPALILETCEPFNAQATVGSTSNFCHFCFHYKFCW